MQKLTTSEKIEEFRQWILSGEDFYNSALNAKYYIEKYEPNQEELKTGISILMFKIALTANILIKPSEIEAIREAIYNIVMRIDV